jgi:serine/threonine protein kinase
LPWKLFSRIILWFIHIGQGTYSNVYRARDLEKEKIVALKKVHFDNLELESVKLKAREILILKIVA